MAESTCEGVSVRDEFLISMDIEAKLYNAWAMSVASTSRDLSKST